MSSTASFILILSREILDELDSQSLSLEDELEKRIAGARVSAQGSGGSETKDVATVVTVAAALAPFVIPTVRVAIERLFPHREVIWHEEVLADGSTRSSFSVKET